MNIQITLKYDQSDLIVEFSDGLIALDDEQKAGILEDCIAELNIELNLLKQT
jgi:hypothetical protein